MRRTAEVLTLASILLLTPLQALAQGYGGPSLLSRGGNTPGRRGSAPIDFTFYGAVRGTYETGLIAPTLDDSGHLQGVAVQGVQVELGAYGAKSSRRSSVGLDYRGDYRKTNRKARSYDGTNQAISLDFTFQPTRRAQIFIREMGGTTNRAFGGFSAPSSVDQPGVPLNDVFDSRVYFSETTGGLIYRASGRTQIILDGSGFFIKRTNRALIGVQGYVASGGILHQLSRVNTVGLRYDFTKFEFPRIYGGSNIHAVSALYQRRLNRAWNISIEVGVYRSDTTGTQKVELSPEVAAVLGRATGVEAFVRRETKPRIQATSTYTLKRASWNAGVISGPGAGNGVYVTSHEDSVHTGYSYTGLRKLSFGVSARYTRFNSLGLLLRNYTSLQGGGGANYRIARHLDLSLQADRRRFRAPGVSGRNGTSIAFGLSYTPAHIPLSIW